MKKMLILGVLALISQSMPLYPSQIEGQPDKPARPEGQQHGLEDEEEPGRSVLAQPEANIVADQKAQAEKTDAGKIAGLLQWIKNNIDPVKKQSFKRYLEALFNEFLVSVVNMNLQPADVLKDDSKKNLANLKSELDNYLTMLDTKVNGDKNQFSRFLEPLGDAVALKSGSYDAFKGASLVRETLQGNFFQ